MYVPVCMWCQTLAPLSLYAHEQCKNRFYSLSFRAILSLSILHSFHIQFTRAHSCSRSIHALAACYRTHTHVFTPMVLIHLIEMKQCRRLYCFFETRKTISKNYRNELNFHLVFTSHTGLFPIKMMSTIIAPHFNVKIQLEKQQMHVYGLKFCAMKTITLFQWNNALAGILLARKELKLQTNH